MWRKFSLVLLIFLLILSLGRIEASNGSYIIQNFKPSDYLAGIQNIDFAQNRNRSIFVANNLGILSYNGNQWHLHDKNTGKKKRSLAFDEENNRLYAGSQGDIGYYYKDWAYVSLANLVSPAYADFDEVWEVFIEDGIVYFCTFQRIFMYDGQKITVLDNGNRLNKSFKVDTRIFTQTNRGILLELVDGQFVQSFIQDKKDNIIAGIIPFQNGILLFYNSGDIEYSTNNQANSALNLLSAEIKGSYVNGVTELSDGRLAIATQTKGLYIYNHRDRTIENISTNEGLLSNSCLNIFQDYTGNLWVGMQNGIAYIQINSPIRLLNKNLNLEGSGYSAYQTSEETYYATSNGLFYKPNESESCFFIEGTSGPAYRIQKIDGRIYAGHHRGLFSLSAGKAVLVGATNGLWQIKTLKSQPDYAIGGTYSGLFLFKKTINEGLIPVGKIDGFSESSRFFEEEDKGKLVVGQYYKGLFELELSEDLLSVNVEKIKSNSGINIDNQVILNEINGTLMLGLPAGVYNFDPNTSNITPAFPFAEEIGNQSVYLIAEDNQNNVHTITEHGVGFFKPVSNNNYVYVPSSLYKVRYLFNNDLLNISTEVGSGILFSANEGFITYSPSLEEQIKINSPLALTKIYNPSIDSNIYINYPFEDKQIPVKEVAFSYKQRFLQFHVESYQYRDINPPEFRFKLSGMETAYSPWSSSPVKEYTNLEDGSYIMNIQTKDHLGQIIEASPFRFRIAPPYYKSIWAKALYILLGLLFLYLFYQFQRKKYVRRTNQIKEEKQREISLKQQKLKELEKQRNLDIQRLEDEKMENELRQTNNLLAASTMNLVVKNEFIDHIKEELKEVKNQVSNTSTKKSLEKIEKEIDLTLRLQEDWQQFEYHFDKVHGDFMIRLQNAYDLSPNEQKLCVFLRLNLNTKEIANLMGVSQRGVEIARYRLRKKLDLHTGQNLSKFILEY